MDTYVNPTPPFRSMILETLTKDREIGCTTLNSLMIISPLRSSRLFLEPSSELIQSLALFLTLTLFLFNCNSFLLARLFELFVAVGDVGFDDHAGEVATVHDLI